MRSPSAPSTWSEADTLQQPPRSAAKEQLEDSAGSTACIGLGDPRRRVRRGSRSPPGARPSFRLVTEHGDAFAALPSNLHAALVHEYIAGAAGTALEAGWINELAPPWLSPEGQTAFYRQIAQLSPSHTRPIVERLDQVRCPTRIGWGEQDPWIPVGQASDLAAALPTPVDVIRFPATGHLVPLEAADALSQDVLRWRENTAER